MNGRWFDLVNIPRRGRHRLSLQARVVAVSESDNSFDTDNIEFFSHSRNTNIGSLISNNGSPRLRGLSSMTLRLLEINAPQFEPIPGFRISGDVRAFQMHIRGFDSNSIQLSLAEFGVELSVYPMEITTATRIYQILGLDVQDSENQIEIRGRYSYRVGGRELQRLRRLFRLMDMTRDTLSRLDVAERAMQAARRELRDASILRGRNPDLPNLLSRGNQARYAREAERQQRLIRRLRRRVQRLGSLIGRTASGMRSRFGRAIARRAMADWIRRRIQTGLLRFIPLLNVAFFIQDAIELAQALYHIGTGQASLGFETGAEEAQENPASDIEHSVVGAPDLPSSGVIGTNGSNGIHERGVEDDISTEDRGTENTELADSENAQNGPINDVGRLDNIQEAEVEDLAQRVANTPISNEAFAQLWMSKLNDHRFDPLPFFKFNNAIRRPLELNEIIRGYLVTNLSNTSRRVIGPVQVRVVRIGETNSRTTVIAHHSFRAVDGAGRVVTVPENNFLQLFY